MGARDESGLSLLEFEATLSVLKGAVFFLKGAV